LLLVVVVDRVPQTVQVRALVERADFDQALPQLAVAEL
jgi:hypothetical protein